eukprot:CAMPEP_0185906872 /NCGR_PEP_ID=MMETSP0196C-20130402/6079_1 /TAXON_ID=2932 /ORGANISM="Alexandrium fundyense, Strain CCMP1719" /LENGTH=74 /DNA_ID=CAMNT_0028626725 /DNA_START=1 /DNA_END=222 /DNA_ORIENTATION=+
MVSLDDYAGRMQEEQPFIYYATGSCTAVVASCPIIEEFRRLGLEVLYMTDKVDDLVVKVLQEFEGKQFHLISEA